MYTFPLRINGDDVVKHIFPNRQAAAQIAIDLAKGEPRVKRLIVFGSVLTLNCGPLSDIDLALDIPEISTLEEFAEIITGWSVQFPCSVDIIHYNTIHNQILKHEIDTKGLTLWEH